MTNDYPVIHNANARRFMVELENEPAILIYMIKSGIFLLLHTEVPHEFEGRGIAGRMARAALDYARQEGYKVRSYCSYTTRFIERHPEYQDLLV